MVRVTAYKDLSKADLIVDAVYEGAEGSHLSGEPMSELLPGIGNLGGFRAAGRGDDKRFIVLYSSGEDKDWPDRLDLNTGQFVYYGDNKSPGHELHDTGPGGNRILRRVFQLLHGGASGRAQIPPFFVFKKYGTPVSARSIQFKGLAVPGFRGLPATSDLVAVWKTSDGQRFQNYRATFTILNVPVVPRAWLGDLENGEVPSTNAPEAWTEWARLGRYNALTSESTTVIRSQEAQMPDTPLKIAILYTVWKHFQDAPNAFESFAARIFQMHDRRVIVDEITRASVDGGRDAVGRYLLGLSDDPVYAEFSLEAKCYAPGIRGMTANTVGVKEVSRLISRIRHRQFGVLVTTSTIGRQAYDEVREDRHPIIFLSGRDIADILTTNGYGTPQLVEELLQNEFGVSRESA
jgi:Restriction endonuclease AspBHI N-terminal/Restriction endonuclease